MTILDELKQDPILYSAVKEFRSGCGQIEQANMQRTRPSPVEVLEMEVKIVRRIAAALTPSRETIALLTPQ